MTRTEITRRKIDTRPENATQIKERKREIYKEKNYDRNEGNRKKRGTRNEGGGGGGYEEADDDYDDDDDAGSEEEEYIR